MRWPSRVVRRRYGACLRLCRDESGSSLPLILLCFLIAGLLVVGTISASGAFLSQRDLQSDCDGAAIAAASGVDVGTVYDTDAQGTSRLPVDPGLAQQRVVAYAAAAGLRSTQMSATVSADGFNVAVACGRRAKIPFGAVFGYRDGVMRQAVSTAQSPLRA